MFGAEHHVQRAEIALQLWERSRAKQQGRYTGVGHKPGQRDLSRRHARFPVDFADDIGNGEAGYGVTVWILATP
jgi:hypothetical protein